MFSRTCSFRRMDYFVYILVTLVVIATAMIQPISGQGWTFEPIGGGWQSDEADVYDDKDITDSRYISYKAVLQTGRNFPDPDLVSFVQLVVDEDNDQLLAGGRDILFRLDLDTLFVNEKTKWASEDKLVQTCPVRGVTSETCHNFIRILLIDKSKNQVLACGTNAFDPTCTWRNVTTLGNIHDTVDGRGICPFSPDHNSTAVMINNGALFAATVIDLDGRTPAITRQFKGKMLTTEQRDSKWLNAPNFISAYEIGNYVYFFFRETAVEFINCGKKIYSRVARLCKEDEGGTTYGLKGVFTSFNKARLNCSLPGEYPFYFDELQSTFYSHDEQLVYAVFTTPPNSIAGSAVCVYNITSFHDVFNGPFKHQESHKSAWLKHDNDRNSISKGKCSGNDKRHSGNDTEESSSDLMKDELKLNNMASTFQLMDKAVQSRETGPLIMREHERWTHIVVDHVFTRTNVFDVLFLATDDGKVRKMMRLPNTNTTCLIEELQIVANGEPRPVKNMQISSTKGAIYISTEGVILKIPVERCYRFTTSMTCLNSQDPYCGWNTRTQTCTPAPDGDPMAEGWEQMVKKCPVLDDPVDGQWSHWSKWGTCHQVGLDRMVDHCLCRSRSCDQPKPRNKGRHCLGPSMEVTNCTVHGNWTEWSRWSSCSATCGLATRTRSRQCGNPPPKFGGNDCIGPSEDIEHCNDNPECPLKPVHGSWSLWSGWTSCDKNCNGGSQTRKRRCSAPMRGGLDCFGDREQWRSCNTHVCPDLAKDSQWSDWVVTNKTGSGFFKQRFKFTCRAPVENSIDIKTGETKTQAQFCASKDGDCISTKRMGRQFPSVDAFTKVDRMLRKFCRNRRRMFKNFCKCRMLGVFYVCQKCNIQ